MTKRYPGGYITKTAPTVSTTSAPGIWTMEQQAAYQKAGTWPFGGPFNYIEDVFSTWLYTGTNTDPNTITNGIDLSTKGGLVWVKSRSTAKGHFLYDTARGAQKMLQTNSTAAQVDDGAGGATSGLYAFNTNGFTLGTDYFGEPNQSGANLVSWTFRKQPKFFDVVTYTGDGTTSKIINHNLGSVPGCIIVKPVTLTGGWLTYHRSLGNTKGLYLNTTAASATSSGFWNNTDPTSTQFTVGSTSNDSGQTFVAYLFAHDAGGFGLTGTDNVISCGSYTGNGSSTGPVIALGYEPQWLMIKNASNVKDWIIFDSMRGFTVAGQNDPYLFANSSQAENPLSLVYPTATGFGLDTTSTTLNTNGDTYIYIAIRRGPMKTPTSGTSVFTPYEVPASPTTGAITGFVTDAGFIGQRAGADKFYWGARLMGNPTLNSTNTNAESANTNQIWDRMDGWWNSAINGYMTWGFKRAPGFMDVVCYTGNGPGTQVVSHNLGAVPELVINKGRSVSGVNGGWTVFQGSTTSLTGFLRLNTNNAQGGDTLTVSSTSFTADSTIGFGMNTSGATYVTYLFASCPGVSKVGRFTGTGATQTISCGFAARFVLIKRTDSTGDWWVWDTARGMIAGTDPRLALNSTAAESNANWVYTDASGFQIVTTDAAVNASGGTYIYLAIA